jgi:hypothetical protein
LLPEAKSNPHFDGTHAVSPMFSGQVSWQLEFHCSLLSLP